MRLQNFPHMATMVVVWWIFDAHIFSYYSTTALHSNVSAPHYITIVMDIVCIGDYNGRRRHVASVSPLVVSNGTREAKVVGWDLFHQLWLGIVKCALAATDLVGGCNYVHHAV